MGLRAWRNNYLVKTEIFEGKILEFVEYDQWRGRKNSIVLFYVGNFEILLINLSLYLIGESS